MTTAVTTLDDVQDVAATVAAGLDQLLHAEYWKLPGDDLLAAARTVEHLARLTYAVQVAVAGEIDLAHLAQTHGQPSTAALLRHALTIGPGDARSRVRAARTVLPQDAISGGEIPPVLPELGNALRCGAVGAEQVGIVVKTMSRIPTDLTPEVRGDPTQAGERPHVTMTVPYDVLTGRLGQATLDATGITIGPAQARRLLCDCNVIPAVLGTPQ
ncbi:DUF222 domain-containing protein [Nakamurella sp.]|uniref:DUF222 domain-containing protein n=1 Tax=Nakamurella sp. TaxID=1869182 RepID=UPI0037833B5D